MKPIICFIDDSKFEHDLVHHEIAPSAPHFEWVQAYTFDEARSLLDNVAPSLFLLDLWGHDDEVTHPQITPMPEVLEKIAHFPTLEDVYLRLTAQQEGSQ
jgi:hypothetical protein